MDIDYCVIMCGGTGSRFWPVSRHDKPKQFLDIFGTGRSLLQMSYDRMAERVPPSRILLVTHEEYVATVRSQLPDVPEENILTEPARRNTAPAVLRAMWHINTLDPQAAVAVMPADLFFFKQEAFLKALEEAALQARENGRLMMLGIRPTAPSPNYRYVQRGKPTPGSGDTWRVTTFTGKPDAQMARLMVESGEFLWNPGVFVWRPDTLLRAYRQHAPQWTEAFEHNGVEAAYSNLEPGVLEYDVLDKVVADPDSDDTVYVKEVDLGWCDITTWNALYEVAPKSKEGNVMRHCRVLSQDCERCLFVGDGDKLVIARGLKDYVVIDHGDALVIVPRDSEESLRATVRLLPAMFGPKYK